MFRKKPSKEPMLPPEWLIIGLGNPGPEYSGTRHNVGFEVIDRLASSAKKKLDVRKHRAVYGQAEIAGVSVVLMKPMTFMNLSGQAAAPVSHSFGIAPERVLVISDDLDLPVGKLRVRSTGSAGGHNGHKSIIQALGTIEYPRIRIGVGKTDRSETIDHVLGKFTPDERSLIDDALKAAVSIVEVTLREGLQAAMSQYN